MPLQVCNAPSPYRGDSHERWTSPAPRLQVNWPINSVLNYTQAYACYASEVSARSGRAGQQRHPRTPQRVSAPAGSPAECHTAGSGVGPASVRSLRAAGHLRRPVPRCCRNEWWRNRARRCGTCTSRARRDAGERFVKMFFMNGGHGARPTRRRPCLPQLSEQRLQPAHRGLRASGTAAGHREGAWYRIPAASGRYRGGNAQRIGFRCVGEHIR